MIITKAPEKPAMVLKQTVKNRSLVRHVPAIKPVKAAIVTINMKKPTRDHAITAIMMSMTG
jgi:hypothetical protein